MKKSFENISRDQQKTLKSKGDFEDEPYGGFEACLKKKMEGLMSAEKSGTYGHNDGRKVIMQIENLSKTYFQGKIPFHALRCACITVRKGELLAIMGPSGSF